MAQLRQLRDRGQLRRFHEVSEDRTGWAAASTLQDLFPVGVAEAVEDEPAPQRAAPAGPAAPPAGPAEWFYNDGGGSQQGPVTRDQLAALIRGGQLSEDALVWKEGMGTWQPLTALPELQGLMPPRPTTGRGGAGGGGDVGQAFGRFATDPVGGLPGLCHALGPTGSFALAWGFLVLFDLCILLAMLIGLLDLVGPGLELGKLMQAFQDMDSSTKIGVLLKLAFLAVLPLLALGVAVAIIRLVTRGEGAFGFDFLIAGAALLPSGLVAPLNALVGPLNFEVMVFLSLFSFCLTVLILNSGFTRIVKLPDNGAMVAVPAALLLTIYLAKVFLVSVVFNDLVKMPGVTGRGGRVVLTAPPPGPPTPSL
jgi:hypothetical protein